VLKGYLCEWN